MTDRIDIIKFKALLNILICTEIIKYEDYQQELEKLMREIW